MNDNNDPLIIAGREFRARLIVGTGKYRTMEEMRDAIDASGAEMVTVAIRRLPVDLPDDENLMDHLDRGRDTAAPNHAGCKATEQGRLTARLARARDRRGRDSGQHRDRSGQGPHRDGRVVPSRRGGGPKGLPRRPHCAQTARGSIQSARGRRPAGVMPPAPESTAWGKPPSS